MIVTKGILESRLTEMGLFYFPAFLAFISMWFFPSEWFGSGALLIFAYYFADAGHVFTTLLRFDVKNIKAYKEVFYPFSIFSVLFFACFAFAINQIWYAIVYLTFVHNLKQAYGISAWYRSFTDEKISKYNYFKVLFYGVNILAFLALHFRPEPGAIHEYPLLFIFRFENSFYYQLSLVLYGMALLVLVGERLTRGKTLEAIAFPLMMCGVYFLSFIVSSNSHQILVPLILTHGLAYMGIIRHSSKKLFQKTHVLSLFTIAIGGGFLYWLFLEKMIFQSYSLFLHHFFRGTIFGAIFTHYYLDGRIWRKDHPQIPQIVADHG